jgi:hypothetical protein
MATIDQLVEKVIKEKDNSNSFGSLELLETANKEFEKLVKEGLASKRGYNLMTINEKYSFNYGINC